MTAVKMQRQHFRHVVHFYVGRKNLNNMNLQGKSFTELQALFQVVFKDWQANNLQIERVKTKECNTYSQFSRSRADLRQLARKNATLHNKLLQIDLEMQIRVWTGKND